MWYNIFAHQKWAFDIGVHPSVPVFNRQFMDSTTNGYTGIIQENINFTILRNDIRNSIFHAGFIGDIALDG